MSDGELIYAYAPAVGSGGRPGTYKIGARYNSLKFDNVRIAGVRRDGKYALYGVIDQTLWQGRGGELKDPSPSTGNLSVFARGRRAAAGPQPDRLLLRRGLQPEGPDPRPRRLHLRIAAAYAHISKDAQRADCDDGTVPVRSSEIVFEASYQAVVAGLKVQPFAPYVVRPGGDLRPAEPTRRIKNATVLGVRTQVEF